MPNSDMENEDIFSQIYKFEREYSNVHAFKSLGMVRYLSTLKYVDMVVGNSSSGIIEVPSFKIPTINIGNRQKGRVQASSVINCKPMKNEILNAILTGSKLDCQNVNNPYEKDGTLENIIHILKTFNIKNVINKNFYDLKV